MDPQAHRPFRFGGMVANHAPRTPSLAGDETLLKRLFKLLIDDNQFLSEFLRATSDGRRFPLALKRAKNFGKRDF